MALGLAFFSGLILHTVSAEESTVKEAKQCYEEKDRACLAELRPNIAYDLSKPEKPNFDAYYYLGLLMFEDGADPEDIKRNLMIASEFGLGNELARAKLLELNENKTITFDLGDCVALNLKDCIYNFADNENDAVAQLHVGSALVESQPKLAVSYLQKSAVQGNETAKCLLLEGVQNGTLETGQSYHDAVQERADFCLLLPPHKRLSKDYFKRYSKQDGHKAYAHSEGGYAYFSGGLISPELAAAKALASCNEYNKKPEIPCVVINVDGRWVKDVKDIGFPTGKMGIQALITKKAVKEFETRYKKAKFNKVFVQSDAGSWSWKSSAEEDIPTLVEKALKSCRSNQKVLAERYPCRVIDKSFK